MCEVLDRIENRGIARGREEGMREGMEKGRLEGTADMLMKYMKKYKCTTETAMDEFDISLSDREVLRAMLE